MKGINRNFLKPFATSTNRPDFPWEKAEADLVLELGSFPSYAEGLYLPQVKNCRAQILRPLLKSAPQEDVPGAPEWKRSITIGEFAGALWLTNGDAVLGLVWCGGTVWQATTVASSQTETGRILCRLEPISDSDGRGLGRDFTLLDSREMLAAELDTEPDKFHGPRASTTTERPYQIEVLLAYTREALSEIASSERCPSPRVDPILGHRLLSQETTNWSFFNSGIDVEVKTRFLAIPSQGDRAQDAKTFADDLAKQVGLLASFVEVHSDKADIIALIGSFSGESGHSALDLAYPRGYCAVDWRWAWNGFIFAHELGHILRADHIKSCSSYSLPNARAWCHCQSHPQWETVMGDDDSACPGSPIPLWSGKIGHVSTHHGGPDNDNSAAILETAEVVAGFGEEYHRRRSEMILRSLSSPSE